MALGLPEDEVSQAIEPTGAQVKREAAVVTSSESDHRRQLEALVTKFGTLDRFLTQDELRRMRAEP